MKGNKMECRFEESSDGDLQHDLALVWAEIPLVRPEWQQDDEFFAQCMLEELRRRGADVPIRESCRWEYSPYARCGKKLIYIIEGASHAVESGA